MAPSQAGHSPKLPPPPGRREQRLVGRRVPPARRENHAAEADLRDDERAEEAGLAATVECAAREHPPCADAPK